MNNNVNILLGIITAFIFNIIGSLLYTMTISKFPLDIEIKYILMSGNLPKIISLGALPNLILFMILMKLRRDDFSKGILITTISTALFILILKMI